MTRITIEIDGSDSHSITGSSRGSTATPADSTNAAGNGLGAPADLLAAAAAVGALNAGPAPSSSGAVGAPVASSIGGAAGQSQPISGGVPSDQLFGTQG